jgi:hypothetical protein
MALLDFPDNPVVGDLYTAPNGALYQWDGVVGATSTQRAPPPTPDDDAK